MHFCVPACALRAARCGFTQGILERLDGGEVVIGDGGFVFALEKRGYVKAGPWTPEAAAEHPEAGKVPLSLLYLFRALEEKKNNCTSTFVQ